MHVLKSSNIKWNKVIECPYCKSILYITADDITVYYNADTNVTRRTVECSECYEQITVEGQANE